MANNRRKNTMLTPSMGVVVTSPLPPTPVDWISLFFSFLPNGASNPLVSGNRGHPFSVVRTSAGLYTVQLGGTVAGQPQSAYNVRQIVAFFLSLGKGAAGSALRAVPGLILDTPGTLQVRLEDATGAATDFAAGTDNRVNCHVAFLNGGR